MNRRTYLQTVGICAGLSATIGQAGATVGSRSDPPSDALGFLEVEGTTEAVVSADGEMVYLATTDGYAIVDIQDPTDPQLRAHETGLLATHEAGPMEYIYDVKVAGDRLLVVGPATLTSDAVEAALLVDVSEPESPETLTVYETGYHIHNCYLTETHAYLCANTMAENGLSIVSLGDDRDELREVGYWSVLEYDEVWEDIAPILRYLHDVTVTNDVACLAYWDAGTWLVDVSDPSNPTYVGHVSDHEPEALAEITNQADIREEQTTLPGNSHYAVTDEQLDLLIVGREAWTIETDSERRGDVGGIDIYTLSDPTAPEHVSSIDAPPTPDPTSGGTWTTAHNFELRNGILYSSWYEGGVRVHDISEPHNPDELYHWRNDDIASFWTAQVGVQQEYFVASSTGIRNTDAGVWLFEDLETDIEPPSTEASESPAETTDGVPGFTLLSAISAGTVGALGWKYYTKESDP